MASAPLGGLPVLLSYLSLTLHRESPPKLCKSSYALFSITGLHGSLPLPKFSTAEKELSPGHAGKPHLEIRGYLTSFLPKMISINVLASSSPWLLKY